METKLSRLKALAASGDWHGALRIAAKFPQLGEHKRAITTGYEAATRPNFYLQIGKDPAALVEAGKQALRARYKF